MAWRIARVAVVAGVVGAAGWAHAADLTAYTEEWPPYNYAEKGTIKGIATDMLRAACREESLACDFKIMPWARAYKIVTATPNTLVYTTARKPSREAEFQWVGPILPRSTWIFGRAGLEPAPQTLAELARLRVGVVRDEAARQDLLDAGVPASALIEQASNAEVLRMLSTLGVDAMVDTEVGMGWNMRNAAVAPKAVRKLMKLSDGGAYYYAFNLNSNPDLIRRVQLALDKLRKKGALSGIVERYTLTLHESSSTP
jgi:polar amino acid transport system substrate-binding protein